MRTLVIAAALIGVGAVVIAWGAATMASNRDRDLNTLYEAAEQPTINPAWLAEAARRRDAATIAKDPNERTPLR